MRCKTQGSAGFSLVEVLVVSAIFIVVVMAIFFLNFQLSSEQSGPSDVVQLSVFQSNLVVLVNNDASWDRTTLLNPSMKCLSRNTQCVGASGLPLQNLPFAIYDASVIGKPYFDSTNPSNGLSDRALPCTGFSALGNDSCPFRFDLVWSAQCTPPNCAGPQVQVSAKLRYVPFRKRFTINPNNYNVPLIYRSAQ